MARKPRDLTGIRSGRLVALEVVDRKKGGMWLCRCDCGTTTVVVAQDIARQSTKSCGCLSREVKAARLTKHGDCGSPEYRSWKGMLNRCRNPGATGFKNYGGRGIKVCERWHSYENFLADMGRKPAPKYSLDRIDCDSDYTPDNCRWATPTEQSRNRRGFVKLNEALAKRIREMARNGVPRMVIARSIAQDAETVRSVLRGRTWTATDS